MYGFDYRNQLVTEAKTVGSTTTRVTYSYDAFGNQIARNDGTNTTWYSVDGWDTSKPQAVGTENFDNWAELNGNNSGALLNHRVYGSGFDEPIAKTAGGTQTWYGLDHQNSVRSIFNNSGFIAGTRTYDAFGAITSSSGSVDALGYTGTKLDAFTQLVGDNARAYDPATGRWIGEDSLRLSAGDPNLYRNVGNQVTTARDPSGMEDPKIVKPATKTPMVSELRTDILMPDEFIPDFVKELRKKEAEENMSAIKAKGMQSKLSYPLDFYCDSLSEASSSYPNPDELGRKPFILNNRDLRGLKSRVQNIKNENRITVGVFFAGTRDDSDKRFIPRLSDASSKSTANAKGAVLGTTLFLDKAKSGFDISLYYHTPVIDEDILSRARNDKGVEDAYLSIVRLNTSLKKFLLASNPSADIDGGQYLQISIVGWSRGCLRATELARRLDNVGIEVAFVGLIDPVATYYSGYANYLPKNVTTCFYGYRYTEKYESELTRKAFTREPIEIGSKDRPGLKLRPWGGKHENSPDLIPEMIEFANSHGIPLGPLPK